MWDDENTVTFPLNARTAQPTDVFQSAHCNEAACNGASQLRLRSCSSVRSSSVVARELEATSPCCLMPPTSDWKMHTFWRVPAYPVTR